mmetsp:Transcript_13768/g.18018  ORF Transcript_13768/g.18018 Transcript_13768/m.18018 type:complete len:97 (-) Transcript_13768:437-727(-)
MIETYYIFASSFSLFLNEELLYSEKQSYFQYSLHVTLTLTLGYAILLSPGFLSFEYFTISLNSGLSILIELIVLFFTLNFEANFVRQHWKKYFVKT